MEILRWRRICLEIFVWAYCRDRFKVHAAQGSQVSPRLRPSALKVERVKPGLTFDAVMRM